MSVVAHSWSGAYRAVSRYDGRRAGPLTIATASVAPTVFVPMVVGSGYAVVSAVELLESEFLWIIGLFAVAVTALLAVLSFAGVLAGVALGTKLVMGDPGTRLSLSIFGVIGLFTGIGVWSAGGPVSSLVGASTAGLALALLLLTLAPRREPTGPSRPATPQIHLPAPPEPPAGRFVL